MRRWLVVCLVALFTLCYAGDAVSQCSGSAGIPFNCQPGGPIGATDLVLGGQNAKTVSFTATQLATFAAGAGQPGVFSTLNVANGGNLSGTFFGTLTFGGNVTFSNAVSFTSGLTLTGVTLTNPTIKLPPFSTAGLPSVTAANAGQQAWVVDCQNSSQNAGNATGCLGIVNQAGNWILASSPSNLPMTIGGQTVYLSGSTANQGNGNRLQLATSSTPGISGQCAQFDANLNIVPSGGGCNSGVGGSGTVSSGTGNQLAYYAANGNTVGGLTAVNNAVLITSGAGVPSESTTLPASLTIPTATLSNAILSGTPSISTATGTGLWTTTASTTSRASLNIPTGVAPTSPNNFDIWSASNVIFARLNGTSYGFAMTTAGGPLTGTSPVTISGSAIACTTCATTTNGGALTGTAPMAISAAGAISIGNINGGGIVQWDSSSVVPAATYYLPAFVNWAGGGTVQSLRFTTGGTSTPSFTGSVAINGAAVTCGGGTTFTVNTGAGNITCTANNTFTNGQTITVVTSGINGSPSGAYIQVNYAHSAI